MLESVIINLEKKLDQPVKNHYGIGIHSVIGYNSTEDYDTKNREKLFKYVFIKAVKSLLIV